MTPLITLQVLGLVFKRRQRALKATAPQAGGGGDHRMSGAFHCRMGEDASCMTYV